MQKSEAFKFRKIPGKILLYSMSNQVCSLFLFKCVPDYAFLYLMYPLQFKYNPIKYNNMPSTKNGTCCLKEILGHFRMLIPT